MGGINESERETDRKKDRLTYRKGRGGSNESERQTDRQTDIYLSSFIVWRNCGNFLLLLKQSTTHSNLILP